MRLDLHTDYALRTLIFLAGRPGRASVAEVAGFYGISKDHVAKVVQALVKMGYVRSQRGAGGGIELARPPDQIRIGQVIAALEGNMHLLDCVGTENVCTIQPGCRLRRVLAHAERIQLDYLNSVRLSDVVEPGGLLREFDRSASGGLGTPPKRGMTLVQIAPSADPRPVEPMLPPAAPPPSLASEGSAAQTSAAQDCAAEATSDQPHPPPPIRRDATAADNHPP
jgi:Rrf2 family nitric oxide-sensitive transcriptional repressor